MEKRRELLARIETSMERLLIAKKKILDDMANPSQTLMPKGTWIINDSTYTYFQYLSTLEDTVQILRHDKITEITRKQLSRDFTLATPSQVEQHISFLTTKNLPYFSESKKLVNQPIKEDKPKFDTSKCDFYMITVGEGLSASSVRHPSYEKAETEAIRLCNLTKKETFIVGVIASVKPVETRKIVISVTPQINKR